MFVGRKSQLMIQNPIPWPNGAKVAVAITFDMDADSLIHIEKGKAGVNYLSSLSMLRYGPEVGIPEGFSMWAAARHWRQRAGGPR